MATILRGKRKGEKVTIAQWCNDWVTVNESPDVFKVTALQYTLKEFMKITENPCGVLAQEFEANFDRLRFKRRKVQYVTASDDEQGVSEKVISIKKKDVYDLMQPQDDGSVHVFTKPGFGLVGMDWSKESIKELIEDSEDIQVGGDACRNMSHGIVVYPKGTKLQSELRFIEHNEEKLAEFEKANA